MELVYSESRRKLEVEQASDREIGGGGPGRGHGGLRGPGDPQDAGRGLGGPPDRRRRRGRPGRRADGLRARLGAARTATTRPTPSTPGSTGSPPTCRSTSCEAPAPASGPTARRCTWCAMREEPTATRRRARPRTASSRASSSRSRASLTGKQKAAFVLREMRGLRHERDRRDPELRRVHGAQSPLQRAADPAARDRAGSTRASPGGSGSREPLLRARAGAFSTYAAEELSAGSGARCASTWPRAPPAGTEAASAIPCSSSAGLSAAPVSSDRGRVRVAAVRAGIALRQAGAAASRASRRPEPGAPRAGASARPPRLRWLRSRSPCRRAAIRGRPGEAGHRDGGLLARGSRPPRGPTGAAKASAGRDRLRVESGRGTSRAWSGSWIARSTSSTLDGVRRPGSFGARFGAGCRRSFSSSEKTLLRPRGRAGLRFAAALPLGRGGGGASRVFMLKYRRVEEAALLIRPHLSDSASVTLTPAA